MYTNRRSFTFQNLFGIFPIDIDIDLRKLTLLDSFEIKFKYLSLNSLCFLTDLHRILPNVLIDKKVL